MYKVNIKNIINRIPYIKPSYDKIINNKVFCDYFTAIPYGKKYLAWFTYYNNENVCIFLQVDIKENEYCIKNAFIKKVCFDNDLSLGTVFYGTIINDSFFCVEDIHYYKNTEFVIMKNREKINLIKYIFDNEIRQIRKTQNDIVFALPLMLLSFKQLMSEIKYLPYKIYCIKCRFFDTSRNLKILYN